MSYICSICTATIDAQGFPATVVDPLAKTMTITCLACRLAALGERSRTRAVRSDNGLRRMPKHNGNLAGNLPYRDE
jgi:DNA-directed RNA polymerase subunit RPC12/RpoP